MPLPYGHFWQDYRGAAIEQHFYAPKAHIHIRKPASSCNILQAFCGWIERLAAPCGSPAQSSVCNNCAPGLNPLLVTAPEPTPAANAPLKPLEVDLPPIPQPAATPESPALPAPQVAPSPLPQPIGPLFSPEPQPIQPLFTTPAPAAPAPIIPDTVIPIPLNAAPLTSSPSLAAPPEATPISPVPAAPRNVVPMTPALIAPAPITSAPTNPAPIGTGVIGTEPHSTGPIPTTPILAPELPLAPAAQEPESPSTDTRDSGRPRSSPLIDLAPEISLPREPAAPSSAPAAPRNRIPLLPSIFPPRNTIPSR